MSTVMANKEVQTIARALEAASADIFSFGVVCTGGMQALTETILQEILLLALERSWFAENLQGKFTHEEYRANFFREMWLATKETKLAPSVGIDVPIGHDLMKFYQLPKFSRAALYLRTKRKLSYEQIGFILDVTPAAARAEVEKSRSILLGRATKDFLAEAF